MGLTFAQHSYGAAYLAGGAVPALKSIMFYEGFLQRVKAVPGGDAFDCCNLRAVLHHRQGKAAQDSLAIANDGTCATLAVIAAFFRSCKI
jgi:hypothetical protein